MEFAPAMGENTGILPGLPAVAGKPIHVGFDGGRLTSDGGILLLAAIEQRLQIAERLAACLEDRRDPDRVVHQFAEMIRYRALLVAAGYPDGNDCDALKSDPAFKMARAQRRRLGGNKAERDRRRELLEALGFLGAAGLRGQPLGEPYEHVEHRLGRSGADAHRRPEFAQKQNLRRFERFVGVLPHPGAIGVGGGKGGLHRQAQRAGIERAALLEQSREEGGRVDPQLLPDPCV
jgi:DDE family transposase